MNSLSDTRYVVSAFIVCSMPSASMYLAITSMSVLSLIPLILKYAFLDGLIEIVNNTLSSLISYPLIVHILLAVSSAFVPFAETFTRALSLTALTYKSALSVVTVASYTSAVEPLITSFLTLPISSVPSTLTDSRLVFALYIVKVYVLSFVPDEVLH